MSKFNTTTDKRFKLYFEKMEASIKSLRKEVQNLKYPSELQKCIS